jgi:hypothetical protein
MPNLDLIGTVGVVIAEGRTEGGTDGGRDGGTDGRISCFRARVDFGRQGPSTSSSGIIYQIQQLILERVRKQRKQLITGVRGGAGQSGLETADARKRRAIVHRAINFLICDPKAVTCIDISDISDSCSAGTPEIQAF